MKSLRFQKLYLCSDLEKAGRTATFDQSKTVIQGENDTGKSCLIKSIYAAFGADAYKVNANWQSLKVDLLLEFTVDQKPYRVLRTGSFFGLFDGHGQLIWEGSGVVGGIGPRIAELLDFKLTLQDRSGEQVVPPPAYCFLPFYIDQDIGWLKTWSSFSRLQMFDAYKHDVAYFHAGLLPNEYYVAKGTKLEAERAKQELKVERRALDRAAERLRARDRKSLRFDLDPAAFGHRVDALLKECQELQHKQNTIQRILSDLSSKRAALLEQKELAANALAELDSDYEFLRNTSDAEIVCPTCGTMHTNNFSNKFGLVSDSEACRSLLIEVQHELEIINQQITAARIRYGLFTEEITRINSLLDEQRGDLKLRDLIEGESERLVDAALNDENRDLDAKIGEQDGKSDEASQTMKSYEDRRYQKPIKDRYFSLMKSFISDLKVPNLSENTYKRIDCTISETGSDLPRALLAYYLAFIHTMRSSTNSSLCPLIIDTPVQQDQDAENAARMIDTCLKGAPPDMQIILGTVGLHDVPYDGYMIKTENKYRLLSKDDYAEVSRQMKPYFAQMLGRGQQQ
jgi:hypothetical protein